MSLWKQHPPTSIGPLAHTLSLLTIHSFLTLIQWCFSNWTPGFLLLSQTRLFSFSSHHTVPPSLSCWLLSSSHDFTRTELPWVHQGLVGDFGYECSIKVRCHPVFPKESRALWLWDFCTFLLSDKLYVTWICLCCLWIVNFSIKNYKAYFEEIHKKYQV